jgi:predicted amidophosphoribosyltransferase
VTVGSVGDAYVLARQGSSTDGQHCPSCGKELDEDLDFCHWCTQRLDGNTAAAR